MSYDETLQRHLDVTEDAERELAEWKREWRLGTVVVIAGAAALLAGWIVAILGSFLHFPAGWIYAGLFLIGVVVTTFGAAIMAAAERAKGTELRDHLRTVNRAYRDYLAGGDR